VTLKILKTNKLYVLSFAIHKDLAILTTLKNMYSDSTMVSCYFTCEMSDWLCREILVFHSTRYNKYIFQFTKSYFILDIV